MTVCGFVLLIAWCVFWAGCLGRLAQMLPIGGKIEAGLVAAATVAGLAFALWSAKKILRQ